MFPHRREPRQPEAKPPVVHTEQSKDYDDSATQKAIVNALMYGEARASVALDGETQSIDEDGNLVGLPRTSTPSTNGVEPTKEKPVAATRTRSKRSKLPYGRKQSDVNHVTAKLAREGWKVITAQDVYANMSEKVRTEWQRAFGISANIKSNISSTLWANKSTTAEGYEPIKAGKHSGEYIIVDNQHMNKPKADNIPEPAPAKDVDPLLERFTHMGYDLDGQPLFRDKRDGAIGRLLFSVLK